MNTQSKLIDQYKQLHSGGDYGASSHVFTRMLMPYIRAIDPESILDFGCGQSTLVDILSEKSQVKGYRFDPAIEEFSVMPIEKADFVINTDVLEHVPEDEIAPLLNSIRKVSENAFFNICIVPALQILPNGQNAHCTVRSPQWWHAKLSEHFPIVRQCQSPLRHCCSFITFVPSGKARLLSAYEATAFRAKLWIKKVCRAA